MQKVLAGGDLALNAVLGVLMFSGIGSSLKTLKGASHLSKLGYLERIWYLRNLMPKGATVKALNKSTMMKVFGTEFYRPLGQKMIYISREAMRGSTNRLWGGFRHELAHVMQEFSRFGKITKPLQQLSTKLEKFPGILVYPFNPIEFQAFALGITHIEQNLGYLVYTRLILMGINQGVNSYVWSILSKINSK